MELPETHPTRIPSGNVHHHPLWHLCPLHHHHHHHHRRLHHHHHHQHPHHHHHQHQFGGHLCTHHNLTHPNLNLFRSFPNLPPPPLTIPCGLQSVVTIPGTVETSSGSKEQQGLDYQFVHEEFQLEEEQEEEEEPMYVMTDEWLEFFAKSEAKRKLEKQQAKLKKKQARKEASKTEEEAG